MKLITSAISESYGNDAVIYMGENINTGSKISGLGLAASMSKNNTVINLGNCELTHCGLGMGIMMAGGHIVLLMKQLDFILLGIDQLINTYNFIRASKKNLSLGSFSIFAIICDQGYQGPQSSFNSAAEISSMANMPIYFLNGIGDIGSVVKSQARKMGVKIFCLSQKLIGEAVINQPILSAALNYSTIQYKKGDSATIVAFNFALQYGLIVHDFLKNLNISSSLYHLNYVPNNNFDEIIEDCKRTQRLIIVDDSKSRNKEYNRLIRRIYLSNLHIPIFVVERDQVSHENYGVNAEKFEVDFDGISKFII